MEKRKIIPIAIIVIIVGLIGWQVIQKIGGQGSASERRAAPVAVETQPIRTATIRDTANFTGTLAPKSQFTVAPKIAG